MSYKFNPFTSNFDLVGGSVSSWKDPVADSESFPTAGNSDGDVRVALAENDAYQYDLGSDTWVFLGKLKQTNALGVPSVRGYTVTPDNTLILAPADATHPGVVTEVAQTIAGSKTFTGTIVASNGIDSVATGGVDVLSIGTLNADVINIGSPTAVINIVGSVNNENVTNLNVKDALVTFNHGGGVASGSGSGFEVEENGAAAGYVKMSADRASILEKAPATAGIATITPGVAGITLDQSSHNPVTLGAVGSTPNANAASLATQVLTLQPADGSNPGVMTAGVQTIGGDKTFSGNISAANLSGTNTGDVTITDTATVDLSLTGQALTADVKFGDSTIDSNASGIKVGTASLTNTQISASAAIAYSKLNLSNSIVNADVASGAAIALSKLAALTASKALVSSAGGVITTSTTTDTEIGYVAGVTSAIQTQLNNKADKVSGDISQTSFSAANNQSSAANVTGLSFASPIKAFEAFVTVQISATTGLDQSFKLYGVYKRGSGFWELSQTSLGDASGIVFTIANNGQVQYTSANYAGFTSATIQFRAIVLN